MVTESEPMPDYPCPAHHKGEWHWWQRKDGGWGCSRCHPPLETLELKQ